MQVKNVFLYISEMQRSLSDKLARNFFNDPSQVRCNRRHLQHTAPHPSCAHPGDAAQGECRACRHLWRVS